MELKEPNMACKDCIFATYKRNMQTGCQLGRADVFRKHGDIVDATDEDKEFFVLNGRLCNAYQPEWGDFAVNVPPENRVASMRDLLLTQLAFIVIVDNNNISKVEKTAKSLIDQTLAPAQALFISNQDVVPLPKLNSRIMEVVGNQITWRVIQIIERGAGNSFVSRERAIDSIANKIRGSYYAVFSAGTVVPRSFTKDLDIALNDHLERFSLLLPNHKGEGLTVQTAMHRATSIGGNAPSVVVGEDGKGNALPKLKLNNIVEKIKYMAVTQDKPYLIKKVTEVCQSL